MGWGLGTQLPPPCPVPTLVASSASSFLAAQRLTGGLGAVSLS